MHGNSKVETLSICRAHNLLYFILDLFYSTKQVLCPEQTVPSSLRIMLVLSKVGTYLRRKPRIKIENRTSYWNNNFHAFANFQVHFSCKSTFIKRFSERRTVSLN